jgi:uncharacterized RDD family membrane protein YckC
MPGPGQAGLVTRALAAAVDAGVVALGTVLVYAGVAGARLVWSPIQFRWPQPSSSVSVAVLVAVAFMYLTIAWATNGRTYGSALLGIRVLSASRRRLGWIRAALRAVACLLVPIGLLWTAVSPTRRSLHDYLFGTVVIYDWHRDGGERAMAPNRTPDVTPSRRPIDHRP